MSQTWRELCGDATVSADWRWKNDHFGDILSPIKVFMEVQKMSTVIRPIVEADKSEWRRLWTAYLEFYESRVSEEVYDTTFSRLLSDDHPAQQGFLAVTEGRPVGLVHYIFHPHNWRIENVCYLQDLYADPEERGKGIGRKLIEAVYEAADTSGCPSVYWLTQDFNTEARKLYDRIATLTPFIKYNR